MELKKLLSTEEVKTNVIWEFGSIETIKQCVRNHLGISLLPEIVVAEELRRKELVKLNWKGPDIVFHAQMLVHRDKWLSPALRALEQLLNQKEKQPWVT